MILAQQKKTNSEVKTNNISFPDSLRQKIDSVIVPDMSVKYKTYRIPKKKSGFRTINAPEDSLKVVQREVLDFLSERINLPGFIHGFVKKKSIASNALDHGIKFKVSTFKKKTDTLTKKRILGKDYYFNTEKSLLTNTKWLEHFNTERKMSAIKMDIKNAFDSVGETLIKNGWEKLYIGIDDADFSRLMKLCLLNGCLPQGAPTSPLLLNIGLLPLDLYCKNLFSMGYREGKIPARLTYTRYADDITVSSNQYGAHKAIYFVEAAAKTFGLYIKTPKTRVMSAKNGVFVTGLSIVNSRTHISVPRRVRNKLRAKIYNYTKTNGSIKELDSIIGKLAYITSIDRCHGGSLIAYAVKLKVIDPYQRINGWTAISCIEIGNKIREDRKKLYEEL